jgi:hypothetical protein
VRWSDAEGAERANAMIEAQLSTTQSCIQVGPAPPACKLPQTACALNFLTSDCGSFDVRNAKDRPASQRRHRRDRGRAIMNSSVYVRNAEMSWRAGWFLRLALAMLTLALFDTRAALATQLHLLRLQCINPATSFGDDIQIFVNGEPAGRQFGIDKSQVQDLRDFTFQVGDETANIVVNEDNDHAADFDVSVSKEGQHEKDFAVKEGGVYKLYYEVIR